MAEKIELLDLGEFEIKSGKAMVSDPCYKLGTWCQGIIDNVKNGKWIGAVERSDEGEWGVRNTVLYAFHESLIKDGDNEGYLDTLEISWSDCDFEVGVDSGQAGIYDLDNYRNDDVVVGTPRFLEEFSRKDEQGSKWYALNCDKTLYTDDIGAGVIPFGVVSSSGYGDGMYTTYISLNDDNEVVAIAIVFIGYGDNEEEDNETEVEE